MSSDDVAIRINGLSKCFQIYDTPRDRLKQFVAPRIQRIFGQPTKQYFREFWALKDVSFEVKKGETVGIVGCNGSGKSTLLQVICGTLSPSSGSVETRGRIAALLELGSGFNPEFTGRENVYMNAAILGLSSEEVDAKFDGIAAFADIGDFIEQPTKSYSSGMLVRLAFAVAINVDPDILIVDEALSVGDELFQRKCLSRIEAIRDGGATILFVSHSASTVVELCDRAVLMDAGEKLAVGVSKKIVGCYQKLLYAPKDKCRVIRDQIRREDLDSKTLVPVEERQKKVEFSQQKEYFDPNFKPSSTLYYESYGASIELPRILTHDGNQVNHLRHGEIYRLLYDVSFSAPAKAVHFSMLIKTVNGIELSGAFLPANNEEPLVVDRSAKALVEFLFTCDLLPGTYYINTGCRGSIRGDERFLHRIVDALCFRVLPREDLVGRAGYYNIIEPVECQLDLECCS